MAKIITEENHVVDDAETNKELDWSDVSPGKASRSPKKVIEAEEVLITSRFSVLASEEEENETSYQNEITEVGQNVVSEDASLQTSTHQQSEKGQNVIIMRQTLPRGSKDKHKFLSDPNAQKAKEAAPQASSKKSTHKHH